MEAPWMGADRKGKCVVRGGLGTHSSLGEGNHIVGPYFNKSIDKDMDILYICIEYPSHLWGGEGSKGVRDVVGFGGGSGPLRHLGEGADRKGECLDRGVYWGICFARCRQS